MRSIKRRFRKISEKYPDQSSLINFVEAIRGQNFKKRTIYFWFNQLVEKDDYDQNEKRAILRQLGNPKPP
jgi:hypothetical protein